MSELILSYPEPEVIKFTLNRPEKRNALNRTLIDAMLSELDGIETKGKVLVLEGAGTNFCSGADLTELSSGVMEKVGKLLVAFATTSIPTIAYVHGSVAAGGVGLAAAVDLAVASPDARFFLPEFQKGIAPFFVSILLKNILSERHFKELAFTCEPFSAQRAQEVGLVNSIGKETLDPYIQSLLKIDSRAFASFKRHLTNKEQLENDFKKALQQQVELLARS
ncbi:MAG: enoyl-CoA hydratase/isomerase family protein [Parachlamydiaceae bacterium]